MSVNMRRIYIEAEREEALKRARAGEAAPSNPAGPALVKRRMLIEFACEPDSELSATMLEQGGDAIRVHKESFDVLKNKDRTRLIEIVDQNPGCDLWGSTPCGPWSTWQYVNLSQYGPEFAVELNEARRISWLCLLPSSASPNACVLREVELHSSGRGIALDGSNRL